MQKESKSPGLPIFLENAPNIICEQVLWLIKNSGLNFQVRETPFSLDINLKKRFTNLWKHNCGTPVSDQSAIPSNLIPQTREHQDDTSAKDTELKIQIDTLNNKLEKEMEEKNEVCRGFLETEQAHKKLYKENKELLKKHEQVCFELKVVKHEKENALKESKTLSVALKSSKRNLENNVEEFEKERQKYLSELEKLTQFKIERDSELRIIRKAEKKTRQKAKKNRDSATNTINTCTIDIKSTSLAMPTINSPNLNTNNINNNVLSANKFEVLSRLSTDEGGVENRVNMNTDDDKEECTNLSDENFASFKDCFREFREAQTSSFESLLRTQQEIEDWFQRDTDEG